MVVTDRPRALHCLERIGYYRLSGYWYPFKESRPAIDGSGAPYMRVLDQFRPGTTFGQVMDLYVFDKRLRLLFLDAIERIEVAVRVQIALLLSARDPWAHRLPSQLHGHFANRVNPRTGITDHQTWLKRLAENERRAKEDFVVHFRNHYSSDLPIWIAIELWDFGLLSTFLGGIKHADQDTIAGKYGLRRDLLTSWMRSINFTRNVCAHHSRLWNISPADYPRPPRVGELPLLDHLAKDRAAQSRIYAVAAAIQFLLRTVNPTTSWAARLKRHFASFPTAPGTAVGQSGFPLNWESLPLWS
jgi:abortive infection bacteriophage resistance protein